MQTVLGRIKIYFFQSGGVKMKNVVYLKNMATQEMIKKLHTLLVNTVVRNNYTTVHEIRTSVIQHFDGDYPNIDQLRYAFRELGITKEKDKYVYQPKENTEDFRICYRCDCKRLNKSFRKCYPHAYGDIGFDNRLVICNVCIEEEERITGQKRAELIGIYALTQLKYKNVLDKTMYKRYWEKYLYG
jgi:hypothetical protein